MPNSTTGEASTWFDEIYTVFGIVIFNSTRHMYINNKPDPAPSQGYKCRAQEAHRKERPESKQDCCSFDWPLCVCMHGTRITKKQSAMLSFNIKNRPMEWMCAAWVLVGKSVWPWSDHQQNIRQGQHCRVQKSPTSAPGNAHNPTEEAGKAAY